MSRERRLQTRVDTDWRVRVGRRGLGVANGRISNASLGGVFIETALNVNEGDQVLMEIDTKALGEENRFLSEGQIVRKQILGDSGQFGYGVQFVKISDAAIQHLLNLIVPLWSSQKDRGE